MQYSFHFPKRLGFLHNPQVSQHIAGLDSYRDCQEIAYLLTSYEFPWEVARALELALFYTYGSNSVSQLLNKTGEFRNHGQKRYDDTALLIGWLIQSGWDGEFGQRAIARMNKTHAHYRIANDDSLFVLWTFIEFPVQWMNCYGRRPFTAHEQQAWFNFWYEIGLRMHLSNIPETKPEFDQFIQQYKTSHMYSSMANKQVADATMAILASSLPKTVRPLLKMVIGCLFEPEFLKVIGYSPAPLPLRVMVRKTLKLVNLIKGNIVIGNYPADIEQLKTRSYPNGHPPIEQLKPAHFNHEK